MGKKRNTKKVTLAAPTNSDINATGTKGRILYGRDAGQEMLGESGELDSVCTASVVGDSDETDNEHDIVSLVDSFADQVENAQDKKIETRLRAIDNLLFVLNKNYIPDRVSKFKSSLFDIIDKNLKRTHEEALRVCSLLSLISVQLGIDTENEICDIIGLMRNICADESVNEMVRSSCAQAIGLCIYLSVESAVHRLECLQTLKNVWSGMKTTGTTGTTLFSSALYSWTLLLERFDPGFISIQIEQMQPRICMYLESQTVEARISAGEALAILHEIAVNNISNDFHFRNEPYLKQLLNEMAVDSSKYRAKRDKKLQKLTFRQIADVICNKNYPHMTVHFNKREKLEIESCHTKLLYDSLCQLLRSDLNNHLTKNEVLRELFDLGDVIENADKEPTKLTKAQKIERLNQFGEKRKQLNINRSKGRAKKDDHKQLYYED